MNSRKEEIFQTLEQRKCGMTAVQVAEILQIDRANASRYLNELTKEKRIYKNAGRPVVYGVITEKQVHVDTSSAVTFDTLVGENSSLKVAIQQAKAAILYPPKGLHTIIFGETGTGKSLFAECMYHFALQSQSIDHDAPFVSFNCADYAQNPQLLFGHIFGIKKGAYTGATDDSMGLLAKADGGILFLDEIHRLPPEGQEMLFTFIDKGIYRPLGESTRTYDAKVQIIGATTESSETFLTTFNRRIPMAINLPNLISRSLDERYEIITLFIKQEANRLIQRIEVEKDAILAFMLYDAEGNIGQVKRDLKLVCAKAFLHYRTHDEKSLMIRKEDCSLQVQKGLLKVKELSERLEQFLVGKGDYLSFDPGESEVVWSHDPERNMQVYNTIEEKVSHLSETGVAKVDLEKLISRDVDEYFDTYVEELTQNKKYQHLLPPEIWKLTNSLYNTAEQKLERKYNEKARFAFALHLQSTIERLNDGHTIIHPDLNNVRKNLKMEFKVAIDLATIIEETCDVEIPFDEIGFISMFLAIQGTTQDLIPEKRVEVIVMMHGKATATSMLETAQELLETKAGSSLDMHLDMEVQTMYEQLLQQILIDKDRYSSGILLLTDMGSLNSFADLIYEETGIPTKAVTMTSTMIVIEALRMSLAGRSLKEMCQTIQHYFELAVKEQHKVEPMLNYKKKAVVVTCFTGEGVAARLYQQIAPVLDQQEVEIIQMQFIERETFLKHINMLEDEYEIKAIAGTVEVDYQNIPFFSAYEIFDAERLSVLQRIVTEEIPIDKISDSLEGALSSIKSVSPLIYTLQKIVDQIQNQLRMVVEPSVNSGLIIHLAFLIDSLKKGEQSRSYPDLATFVRKYRLECDIVRANLMPLEKEYQVTITEDEVAFLTQMYIENKLNNRLDFTHNGSV